MFYYYYFHCSSCNGDMLFNTLGIAHKELPVFISLLDIFAGVVAQLIAVCGLLVLTKQKLNFFPLRGLV